MPVAVVLGITADIGRGLAERLLRDGWDVIGLGRDLDRVDDLRGADLIPCDVSDPSEIAAAADQIKAAGREWDLFVSSVGTMEPIGPFFDLDFDQWERSVSINSTAQLRVLHAIWPQRAGPVDIMLMAGGGTNNPFRNYSAYCVSKIMLIKMCELIDDEAPDANAFIIGPGFTRTRIHEETLRAGDAAGSGLAKTQAFLEDAQGTSLDDIYAHMRWCMQAGRAAAGGRNFSTVHDPWRDGDALAGALTGDADALRLRRAPVRGLIS